jgi:hypothetical protein
MADDTGTGLPDVSEPKVGPERLVHEKEVSAFDFGAFKVLSIAGAICGICMWGAFSWVGGEVNLETLPGAIFGGLVSGWAIFALT